MNVPKLRFKEFTDEWSFTSFNEIFSILNGYAFSSKDFISSQEIILTKIANVDFNCMSKDNLSFLPKEYLNKYSKFILNRNDIVIALTRPILNNNLKIAIVDDFFDKSLLNQRVGKIISKHNSLFVYYMLQTKKCINSINISIAGTDPPNLSPEKITYIKKYLPQSKEQNKIANFLATVDKKIINLENTITSLENQKKGLLQQIFSQKLRFKDKNGNNYPNWEKKKLEDIAIFLDNKRKPLEQSERIHGKYPYYGASGIIDYINDYIFDDELVLLSEDGANIIDRNYPICYIATGKYWVNNHAHVLKVKSQYVNKFICESLEQLNYTKYNTGTAQPKLNQDVCRKIILSIPCLEEQTKIADFLSAFDRKLENQKAQLEHWQQIKKGLLQQMFV